VLLLFLAVAIALAVGACDGTAEAPGEGEPTTTAEPPATETEPPAPTTEAEPPATETEPPTEPPATETEPEETITLSVYFLRGEHIGVAHRTVPRTTEVGRAALEQLLSGPTEAEAAAGLGTEIPEGTELLDLAIGDGIATVDLSGAYDEGGGSLTMFARLAQVVHTLTQFPTVQGVVFRLDGKPVEVFSAEGIVLDHPQTREDYEDLAAPILVESPTPGETVSSPVRVTGTANVFEANFLAQVVDASGEILGEQIVTATCGTGCRGTFDISLPFEWEGEREGKIAVFAPSALDGSPTNVVEIPVTFQ
jgi:spore germination protein GerM